MQILRILLKIIIKVFAVIILGVLLLAIVIKIETNKYIYDEIETLPISETAVVPGASILKNGNLSEVLQDRADKAIILYQAGKVSKILVTGDNSTISYNEVNPVRNYLLIKNIPGKDIFLDHAGFDTYSSMYRARDIFKVNSVIVVTQSFHLPRAVFIARHLGLEATGISADSGHYLLRNYGRELLANVKAVLNLIFGRTPKFLGEEIPIIGDGRDNP